LRQMQLSLALISGSVVASASLVGWFASTCKMCGAELTSRVVVARITAGWTLRCALSAVLCAAAASLRAFHGEWRGPFGEGSPARPAVGLVRLTPGPRLMAPFTPTIGRASPVASPHAHSGRDSRTWVSAAAVLPAVGRLSG
jgi:hypothetical protein